MAARAQISNAIADEFYVVGRTVDEVHFHIQHGETTEHATGHHAFQTTLDRGNELLRYPVVTYLVLEDETKTRLVRLGDNFDAGELAMTAGQLFISMVDRCRLSDHFQIGDLRRTDDGIDLIGMLENIDISGKLRFQRRRE